MNTDKIYMFGNEGGDLASVLPSILNNRGMDPNLVAALMNGNGNRNAWGGDSWWIWIILLFFCGGFGGFGGNRSGLPAELNGDAGRELLMNAIQGNGNAIGQLASSLNCSTQQIQSALCGLQGTVDKIGSQIGLSGQQIINAIQAGNTQIMSQMAACCCDLRESVTKMGYENQLATLNQTNTLVGNANTQFNIVGAKIDAQTQIINDKFCQLEMREMQNKLDAERAKNAALATQLSQEHQSAEILAPINALKAEIESIKCKMPPTVAVQYPQLHAFNSDCFRAAAMGATFGETYGAGGFWR